MAEAIPTSDRKPPRTRLSASAETRRSPKGYSCPPGPIAEQVLELADVFARSQHQLVIASAAFADSAEWVVAGAPNAARWLAERCFGASRNSAQPEGLPACDMEVCTAREWIRIGRRLEDLPVVADAFADRTLSYSKVRTLTRVATPENETELVELAVPVPASDLGRVIAAWMNKHSTPEGIAALHHRQRSVKWRTEPDGMVTFSLRLPPHLAAILIALLTTLVMRTRPRHEPDGSWPTLAQQHADAVKTLLSDRAGTVDTEVVLHVRGDGATCDDGTPIADTVIAEIAPGSFIRALVHDADGRPINASARRRHPTDRQKRVVKERDRSCVDCGRVELLEYDHDPAYEQTRHTVTDELELRCAPCHQRRHRQQAA